MKKEDEAHFIAIMKVAADLYSKEPLSDDALKMFFMLLQKYSIGQVGKALQGHMAASPYMPKPCDVISRIEGTQEERAALAWPIVLGAVERLGHSHSIAFPSPAYVYAMKQMGGWIKFSKTLTEDEVKWRRREFERLFPIGERVASWENEAGKVCVERYCVGAYEIKNRSQGYELPEVMDATTFRPLPGFRESLSALKDAPDKQVGQMLKALAGGKRAS